MAELQGTFSVEVLKEGCASTKETVLAGLSSKVKFIQAQFQKDLSESLVKRINIEEEHVKNVAGMIKAFEALVGQLELELQQSRERERSSFLKAQMALKESNEYMDKYYDCIIRINGLTRRNITKA